MMNGCLLDPEEFEIEPSFDNEEECEKYCKRLIEKWSPELEREMLEAFIRFYYDNMYEQWGPDDHESRRYHDQHGGDRTHLRLQLPVQNQIPCAGSFGCQRIHVALGKPHRPRKGDHHDAIDTE